MARREKQSVHRVVMTGGKRDIIRGLPQEYDIPNAQDIQDAPKDLLGRTIHEMMEAEMNNHLGYAKSERTASEGFISDVTDKILVHIEEWQNRPLDKVYPVFFIDVTHYSVRDNGVIRKLAVYVILGIRLF